MDLMWQQRSADIFLGLPYDIAMYGLLLEMLAKGAKLEAGQLSCSLGDCHLYKNHLDQAELQLSRSVKELPSILLNKGITLENNKVTIPQHKDVNISSYKPHPNIKADISVGT